MIGRRLAALTATCLAVCVTLSPAPAHLAAASTGGTTTADEIVLTQSQLLDYRLDPDDSITNPAGGNGSDLEMVLAACFGANALLSQIDGGAAASIGDSFARGTYQGGFQNGVQSIAFVGSSTTEASTAFAVVAGSGFRQCFADGLLRDYQSLVQVSAESTTTPGTPAIGDAVTAVETTVHFGSSGLSGVDSISLTTVRVGPAIAMLETFAVGADTTAATFPDQDRVALVRVLATRIVAAGTNPVPTAAPAEPDLADCPVVSDTVESSATLTAASVTLGGNGALTQTQSAAIPGYSFEAEGGLKPGLTAAFGAADGDAGLHADASVGIQFSASLGYDHLYQPQADALMKSLLGSAPGDPRLSDPDTVGGSVGVWLNGDIKDGASSGEVSGSVSVGLEQDLLGGTLGGQELYVDLTGTAKADLGQLLGGMSATGGSSDNADLKVAVELTPDFDPTRLSAKLTTEGLTAAQVKGAIDWKDISLTGSQGTQKGVETDLVADVSAEGEPVVKAAIETLLEWMLDTDGTGPSDSVRTAALSTLASHATVEILQSSLTKGTVNAEVSAGEGLAWGAKLDSSVLDKRLTYAAFASEGSTDLSPWTTCNAAIVAVEPRSTEFGPIAAYYRGATGGSGEVLVREDGIGAFQAPDTDACPTCNHADAPQGTIAFTLAGLNQSRPDTYTARGTVTAVSDVAFGNEVGVRPGSSFTLVVDPQHRLTIGFLAPTDVLTALSF